MLSKANKVRERFTDDFVRLMFLTRSEINLLMLKEDLFHSFLKLTHPMPSDEDCQRYMSFTPKKMKYLNNKLSAGFSLDDIKNSKIWKL